MTELECMIYFFKINIENIQVSEQCSQALILVKRETGESPVRTRHRNLGVRADVSLGNREDGLSVDH